jgi:hypothetical protein
MMGRPPLFTVTIAGQPAGILWKEWGRIRWQGKSTAWPRGTSVEAMRIDIARIRRTKPEEVSLLAYVE